MKKTFQKTLMAAAAGMALAAGVAHADDNLLFPYISSVSGGYTFISITADGNAAIGGAAGGLHYYYMTKPAGSASACEHFDGVGGNTENDLFQFEMSKQVDLITVTGDTTSTPLTMASTGKEGFLMVNAVVPNALSRLTGEVTLVSVASGLMHTYNGITTASAADPDFGATFTGLKQANRIFQWYADPAVATSFFVVPVDAVSNMKLGDRAVALKSSSNKGIAGDEGAFDNNEKLWSGAVSKTITCFGSLKPSDMLGSDTFAKVKNGGYMNVAATIPAGPLATGWAVSKVQKIVGSNLTSVNRPASAALTTNAVANTGGFMAPNL